MAFTSLCLGRIFSMRPPFWEDPHKMVTMSGLKSDLMALQYQLGHFPPWTKLVQFVPILVKKFKNIHFLTLKGCHGTHLLGLFELPQKVVSRLKIGPET